MKATVVLICILLLSSATANAVIVQVKLEKDSTDWTTLDEAIVTYESGQDGERVVYDTLPDPNSVGVTNLQEWFVIAEDGGGYNLLRFNLTDTIIPLPGNQGSQYWLHYGIDGLIWSPTADKTVLSPPRATPR